jgi:hypothetical protein
MRAIFHVRFRNKNPVRALFASDATCVFYPGNESEKKIKREEEASIKRLENG